MPHSDFDIKITKTEVAVRYEPSKTEPHGKLFGFVFIVSMIVLMNLALLFIPGKHGSSMWSDMRKATTNSSDFFVPLSILLLGTTFVSWQGFRYARAAWASDETFRCDRDAITISRVPWLDFSNRTSRTYAYPLSEVSAIRFAVIASAKGRSFWGIRFKAHGRKWALPGLEAPEAKTILDGLKVLGADVPDDPKLDKRIQEALGMRFGDTSWLDRSWMEKDKQ